MEIKKKLYNFQLIVPIIIIFFGTIESFLGNDIWSSNGKVYWRFFANVIMLNSLHVAMTFIFMAMLPDFRSWYSQEYYSSRVSPILQWFLFFVFIFIMQLLERTEDFSPSVYIKIVLLSYAIFHTSRQNLGLSILINRKRLKVSSEKIVKLENFERKLVWIVVVCTIFPVATSSIPWLSFGIETAMIRGGCALIMCVSVLHLVCSTALVLRKKSATKVIFLMRYLIYPLSLYSFLGIVGVGIMHGVEYLFVVHHLMSRASKKNFIIDFATYSSVFLFVIVFWLSLMGTRSGIAQFFISEELLGFIYGKYSSVLLGSIVFLHYHIDGKIFKFSQPGVRKNILPLFEGF